MGASPLQFIQKEREDDPYENRQPWTPGTHDRILKEHMALLEKYRVYHTDFFTKNLAAAPASLENEHAK